MFGRMCLPMIRKSEMSRVRAASTYGSRACTNAAPRTSTDLPGDRKEEQDRDRKQVAATEHADHDHRDKQSGQREDQVCQPADDGVDGSTAITGEKPERGSDQRGPNRHAKRTDQRRACPDDEPREDVTAQLVGAEQVGRARRNGAEQQVLLIGVLRGDQRSRDQAKNHEREEPECAACQRGRPPASPKAGVASESAARKLRSPVGPRRITRTRVDRQSEHIDPQIHDDHERATKIASPCTTGISREVTDWYMR